MKTFFRKIHSLSLYAKLAFLIFSTLTLFIFSIVMVSINISQTQTNQIVDEMIENNIQSNKYFLSSSILAHDEWALYRFLKAFATNSFVVDVGIVDKEFVILAHSNPRKNKTGNLFIKQKKDKIIPFKKDNILLGYFIIDVERDSIKAMLEKSFINDVPTMVIIALLIFFVAIYFMKNLLERLTILKENVKAISLKKWEEIQEIKTVENDEITDIILTTTDIVKKIKESELKQKDLRNFYQNILGSMDVLIIICDKNHTMMYHNKHNLSKVIIKKESLAPFVKELIECYQTNSCSACGHRISHKSLGDRTLFYQVKKLDEYILCTFSDITQLTKLQENEKIVHSLKTMGEISSLFAHEIKNLLQPLKFLLQDFDELNDDDVVVINNTIDKIDAQVLDFLSLGKPITDSVNQNILVEEKIENILDMMKPKLIKKDIKISYKIPKYAFARIGKKSFEMIVENILYNAIEAIENNGTIEIIWSEETHNNLALLKITDNGKGISKEIKEKIFKPFFTTKPNGSGLGLFTVSKIVYQSGGEIYLDCEDKTTFLIYLPKG